MSKSDLLLFILTIHLFFNSPLINGYISNIRSNNDSNLWVKLQGKKDLEIIKNLFNISLYLLDLSYNQNTFEIYFGDINKLETLKVLNMSHNNISTLREKQFNGLVELIVLDLSYNEIFYFEGNAFQGQGLDKLIDLNLKNNQLREIEQEDLNNLLSLQNINIDFNKLRRIRYGVFNSLAKIENISLQNNKIKQIDKNAFSGLFSLKNIWLNRNKIKEIDKSLIEGLNLTVLNLSSNLIETVDAKIFNFSFKIDLSDNLIKKNPNLTNYFENYSQTDPVWRLEEINLDKNQITTMNQTGFIFLKNIKTFVISTALIRTINYVM